MLHGLFWLTANLTARRPALLAIDDLHWCDPSSLRWLAYLLARLEGLSLLVVGSGRPSPVPTSPSWGGSRPIHSRPC
jgi:predicted ATPase